MLSLYKGGEIGKRPLTRGLWLTGRAHALQDFLLKKKKEREKEKNFGALVQGVQQMETALLVKLLR